MASATRRYSSKPIIGVTGNDKAISPSWICIRFAILLAGGKARRISVQHEIDLTTLDGLIVSGGDDIHPSLYDGKIALNVRYDQPRDELEKRYIEFAMLAGLPILGICRGYQLINIILGGSLFSDIKQMRVKTSNRNTLLPRKLIRLESDSSLKNVIGSIKFKVNSLHHQAIDRLGEQLLAVGHDTDNIVQAIECDNECERPIMGVQWHPEYMLYISQQLNIFRWLVKQAKEYSLKSAQKAEN